jgi:hypothetical protein
MFSALIGLGIALTVIHFWRAQLFDRRAAARVDESLVVSQSDVDAAEAAVGASTIVWWALVVATVVLFITWQYRHAQNGRALGATGGLSHPAWAIAGWLIPIANVVLGPRQIYRSRAPGVGRSTMAARVIPWWMITLVLSALVLWLNSGVWVDAATYRFDFLRNSTADYLKSVAALLTAPAAACALYMVRALTRRQNEAFERVARRVMF